MPTPTKVTDPDLLKQLGQAITIRPVGAEDDTEERERRAGPHPDDPTKWRFHGHEVGNFVELMRGVSQGLIDPIEGIAQLAEHSTGMKLAPDIVRQYARDWRKRARGTYAGVGGEVLGNVLPALLTGGASSLGEGIIAGAVAGGAQPVEGGGDYWQTKLNQVGAGAFTGGAGPAVARGVAGLTHIPPGIAKLLGLSGTTPLSQIAQQASQYGGGPYGAVSGNIAGQNPVGQPPPPAPPAPPPAPPGPVSQFIEGVHNTPYQFPGVNAYRAARDLVGMARPAPSASPPPPPVTSTVNRASKSDRRASSFKDRFQGSDDDDDEAQGD
jgi:hypothetical protein